MSKATTTQKKVDYFHLPRPLWRKLKKSLPNNKKTSTQASRGGRPRASDRVVINGIWYVLWTGCQWKAVHRDWFGVSSSVIHERFQSWTKMGIFEKLMKKMAQYYARERGGIGWKWQAMDSKSCAAPFIGRKPNRQEPHRQRQTRSEDKPDGRRARGSPLDHPHRSQSPRQDISHRPDRLRASQTRGEQGAASVRGQSLRRRRRKGVRSLGGLHRPHQNQSQEEQEEEERPGNGRGVPTERWRRHHELKGSPGEALGGGANDLMVQQAPRPPHAVGEEIRELVIVCSACLRSHLAQFGSSRIESKLDFSHHAA